MTGAVSSLAIYQDSRVRVCVRCNRSRRIGGRGLCDSCYPTCRRNGTLHQFSRAPRRTAAETAAEALFLASAGAGHHDIAVMLGITPASVEAALRRARNARGGR